jgi:hypothetical protein
MLFQQYMMEFLINERDPHAMGPQTMHWEACLPRNSILQQMKADEKIVVYFNLHHTSKKEWLLENWAGTFIQKQSRPLKTSERLKAEHLQRSWSDGPVSAFDASAKVRSRSSESRAIDFGRRAERGRGRAENAENLAQSTQLNNNPSNWCFPTLLAQHFSHIESSSCLLAVCAVH